MASTHNVSRQQRRETWLYLIVPMIGAGVMVLVGAGVVLLLPHRSQVSLIADWMTTVFLLCPAVLCLFGLAMVLVIAVAAMQKLHILATQPLVRLEALSQTLTEKTFQAADTINQATTDMSVRLATLDPLLDTFNTPSDSEDEEKHDG